MSFQKKKILQSLNKLTIHWRMSSAMIDETLPFLSEADLKTIFLRINDPNEELRKISFQVILIILLSEYKTKKEILNTLNLQEDLIIINQLKQNLPPEEAERIFNSIDHHKTEQNKWFKQKKQLESRCWLYDYKKQKIIQYNSEKDKDVDPINYLIMVDITVSSKEEQKFEKRKNISSQNHERFHKK